MPIDLDEAARNPFLAGVAGSVMSLKFAPGAGWLERVGNVLAGSLCAGYAAPAAAEFLHLSSRPMQALAGFVLGMFGLSLCAAIIDWLRSGKLGDSLSSWTTRR